MDIFRRHDSRPAMGIGFAVVAILVASLFADQDQGPQKKGTLINPYVSYLFNSTASTQTVTDETGRLPGAVVDSVSWTQDRGGTVCSLSGAGYIDIPVKPDVAFTNGLTIEAWVCPGKLESGRIIDQSMVGDADSFCLDTHPGDSIRFITPAGTLSATQCLAVGTWVHVTAVYEIEQGQMLIYLNGELRAKQDSKPGVTIGGTRPIRIGADSLGSSRFVGKLDDIRLYALSLDGDAVAARFRGKEVEIIPQPICYSKQTGRMDIDDQAILAHNDLVYLSPAAYPVEGLPIGNGNLGVVVWNANGLDAQLNNHAYWNNQVQPVSSGRIHVSSDPSLIKGYKQFDQRLSLYDGILRTTVTFPDGVVEAVTFVVEGKDLLVTHIADNRKTKGQYTIDLNLWREWGRNEAIMDMTNNILRVNEKATFAATNSWLNRAYALVVATDTKSFVPPRKIDESTLRLTVLPESSADFTIFAANPVVKESSGDDPLKTADLMIADAKQRGWQTLMDERQKWWTPFWKQSWVHLSSPDGVADYMENLWYLHLYWMACQSRGEFSPKFNGGAFLMNWDYRGWGGCYWYQNTRELHWPLLPANHIELIEPFYRLYQRVLPVEQEMTRTLFGVEGAQYEETMDIFGGGDKHANPYTCLYLTTGTELSLQFYRHYLFTRDEAFLRERAYPIIKETCRFYVNWVKKEKDGFYHTYPTGGKETYWRVKDAMTDFCAMRRMFPVFIEISDKLKTDADLRKRCREILDHLPPYALNPENGAWSPCVFLKDPPPTTNSVLEKLYTPANTSHAINENKNSENTECEIIFPWELVGIGTPDYDQALKTFRSRRWSTPSGWDQGAVWAARLGLGEEAGQAILAHARSCQVWPQGFYNSPSSLYWCDRMYTEPYFDSSGVNAMTTCEMLLQSHDSIIRVFPAFPRKWSGAFMLRAQSGFMVSSEIHRGTIQYVVVESLFGDPCRIANPWSQPAIVSCNGRSIDDSDKPVIEFKTKKGQRYFIESKTDPIASMVFQALAPTSNTGPKWPGLPQKGPKAFSEYLDQGHLQCLGLSAEGLSPLRYRSAACSANGVRELRDTAASRTNLALSRLGAVATLTDPSGKTPSVPRLNDGIYGFDNITWVIPGSVITIDLGKPQTVSAVYWSMDRQCNLMYQPLRISDYSVEISEDGKQWKTVATVSKNDKSFGRWDGFEPATARFVKFTIKANGCPRVGIDEIDVY